jgi:hypothetical protein
MTFSLATKHSTTELILQGLVPQERIELPTFALQVRCSTSELQGQKEQSRDLTRQGRVWTMFGSPAWDRTTDTLINSQVQLPLCYWGIKFGGATETRTQNPAFTERRISNPL